MARIWELVNPLIHDLFMERLRRHDKKEEPLSVVLTSGGFDPLHVGHVRCLQAAARLGNRLLVLVNGDEFLKRKKGYAFMPAAERAEIVAAIAGVTDVLIWEGETQYVDRAIRLLRPQVFAKGGDRSTLEAVAECERLACNEVKCRLALGVGGADKPQSSSRLVEAASSWVSRR